MEDSEDGSDSSQTTLTYSSAAVSSPASLKACDPLQTDSGSPDYNRPSEDLDPDTDETVVPSVLPSPTGLCPSSSSEKVRTT